MAIATAGRTGRATRQRIAVAALLDELAGFHSAQEVHHLLKQRGEHVGLTTVYRSLQILADAHEVDVLRTIEGEKAYRRCSATHHHHLVCRNCGRTVEVDGPAVERWTRQVAADHGYADVNHTLEIFGACPLCAAPAARSS